MFHPPGNSDAQARLPQAVAAHVAVHGVGGLTRRGADQRNHAARVGAIQRRERAAQDLDALRTGNVEVRHLSLPVGHGRGDAIGVQAQATDAEGGARTETARADLQVLRVVVAQVDHQAGHAVQRL
jgi:hypothetical protein